MVCSVLWHHCCNGGNMEFKIIRAVPEDAGRLNDIMQSVAAGMKQPEWFMKDDFDYIKEHIGRVPLTKEDVGFILKAVCEADGKEQIAGFFMVAFPGLSEKNLGHHIDLCEEQLKKVAHMESVVILSEYRGHGLQFALLGKAEEVIREETEYRILMATVHPDNIYSLRNVQAQGYEVVAEALKYGGYPRYIVKKEI